MHEDLNSLELLTHAFRMPDIKDYDYNALPNGGTLWVLYSKPTAFDCILELADSSFKVTEYS